MDFVLKLSDLTFVIFFLWFHTILFILAGCTIYVKYLLLNYQARESINQNIKKEKEK